MLPVAQLFQPKSHLAMHRKHFRLLSFAVALALASQVASVIHASQANPTKVQQFHTATLSFTGPQTSETASPNPFTDYRLLVTFVHQEKKMTVRGFYAADGDAANSSAAAGNVWQARFTPDRAGTWTWSAKLKTGSNIAINADATSGDDVKLKTTTGTIEVVAGTADPTTTRDLKAHGHLIAINGFFRFAQSGKYWLKRGTDSPENFLAFHQFDGTYRISADASEGEAAAGDVLHHFPSHVADWTTGDPTWKGEQGKAIIGAINYLASTGMNVAYFLTMNIGGDGKDVWPFLDHKTFDRFDVSKLDQWEILFSHMQAKGVMLHVVTQETENEKLLDDGDTGPQRKLYYLELIARFGHHPGVVWNLGEENGPADFSPNGQTTAQRRAMAKFFQSNDPYQHPVLVHTHSTAKGKEEIVQDLLGDATLTGLSFQVDDPKRVHSEIAHWIAASEESGKRWMITMDEVGPWHTGTLPDEIDPNHDGLRHHVMWGSLMAGAAGFEWYFGAKHPGNDLTAEDWRTREAIWKQSNIAAQFFEKHIPWWEMKPAPNIITSPADHECYCFAKTDLLYLLYIPAGTDEVIVDLEVDAAHNFRIQWFDPTSGGELSTGTVDSISGSGEQTIGLPPWGNSNDAVTLLKKAGLK